MRPLAIFALLAIASAQPGHLSFPGLLYCYDGTQMQEMHTLQEIENIPIGNSCAYAYLTENRLVGDAWDPSQTFATNIALFLTKQGGRVVTARREEWLVRVGWAYQFFSSDVWMSTDALEEHLARASPALDGEARPSFLDRVLYAMERTLNKVRS